MQQLGDNFSFDIVALDGEETIYLAGVLDEYVQLSQVRPTSTHITVDLAHVTRLNSVGVREFRNFMERLKDCTVRVRGCSEAVVAQASLVSGFLGGATVESFCVPFFCERCTTEVEHMVQAEAYREHGLPTLDCSRCDQPLAFDGEKHYENFYFSFLDDEQ